MKINCLYCGHSLDLGDAYEDFKGKIKCFVCGGLLELKTENGLLKAVDYGNVAPMRSTERPFETIP